MTEEKVHLLKMHKRWADGLTLIWIVLALCLLTGFHFLLDRVGIDPAERTAIIVLLGINLVIAAIWQAVGLGVARVHMIVKGIDLGP